jgi:hypothetical protein
VVSEAKETFQQKANSLLKEGWALHGDPAFSLADGEQMITQVFIKKVDAVAQDYQKTKDLLGEAGGDA